MLGAPLAPAAQQSRTPQIGWLSAGSEPDPFLEAFREALRKLGNVEGQNVVLNIRHAHGNVEVLRAGAAALAESRVALIVAGLTAVRAARAVKDIPVLFAISGDPVEGGIVQTLSRPGGNLTGSTFLSLEVAGKRVELLKQAVPGLRSLAVLSNVDHPGEKSELHATEAAAQKLAINVIYVAFSQSPFEASPARQGARDCATGAARRDDRVSRGCDDREPGQPRQLRSGPATADDVRLERVCGGRWIDQLWQASVTPTHGSPATPTRFSRARSPATSPWNSRQSSSW